MSNSESSKGWPIALTIGTMLALATVKPCSETSGSEPAGISDAPSKDKHVPKSKSKVTKESLTQDSGETPHRLKAWLEEAMPLLDSEDPCLEQAIDVFTQKSSSPTDWQEEKKAWQECAQTKESGPSRSNYFILESTQGYDANCGGEKRARCDQAHRELQELLSKDQEGWTLVPDYTWAYDTNGEILDAAAFPGLQKWVRDGNHDDLLSVSIQFQENGDPIYGLGVSSSHDERGGTPVMWSGPFSRSELLDQIASLPGER